MVATPAPRTLVIENAHKKGAGSTKNGRTSIAQRRGVKVYGGQPVVDGGIIIRQVGNTVSFNFLFNTPCLPDLSSCLLALLQPTVYDVTTTTSFCSFRTDAIARPGKHYSSEKKIMNAFGIKDI